jgi:predicted aspartyl protease
LALLDTGFNGELLVARSDIASLGILERGGVSEAELAGGQVFALQRGEGRIVWLGRERRVDVLISSEAYRPGRDGDPIALIGTRLLVPHLLLIDFAAATVEIEAQNELNDARR